MFGSDAPDKPVSGMRRHTRVGIVTPVARKATSLIISLRLNLRNHRAEALIRTVCHGSELEATPSANNVILWCAQKAEITCAHWPSGTTFSMVIMRCHRARNRGITKFRSYCKIDTYGIIAIEGGQRMTTDEEAAKSNGHIPASQAPIRRQPRWHDYTAFVLSGGGARGALQVGALRALLEHGEHPDIIIGTSVGAWNGAWLAMGPSLERMETMAHVWETIHPMQVLLGRERVAGPTAQQAAAGMLVLAAARNVTRGNPSLYGDTGLRQMLERYYSGVTFEGLEVPLYVIATNLKDGARTVFSSGTIGPALLASSAIPGIFPPVRIADATYVDGGAIENCGLDIALTLGARRLFILDVGYDASPAAVREWSAPPTTPPDVATNGHPRPRARRERSAMPHALASVLERTTQVMSRYQLDHDLAQLPPGIEAHVIRPSTSQGGGALDFDAAPQWIKHGYEFTRTYLARVASESSATEARMFAIES